jgi:hypothetical protein
MSQPLREAGQGLSSITCENYANPIIGPMPDLALGFEYAFRNKELEIFGRYRRAGKHNHSTHGGDVNNRAVKLFVVGELYRSAQRHIRPRSRPALIGQGFGLHFVAPSIADNNYIPGFNRSDPLTSCP